MRPERWLRGSVSCLDGKGLRLQTCPPGKTRPLLGDALRLTLWHPDIVWELGEHRAAASLMTNATRRLRKRDPRSRSPKIVDR
jgi:hypothetical protein